MHYSQDDMVSLMCRYLNATGTNDLTDDQVEALRSISYVREPGVVDDEMWQHADNVLTRMGF